MNTMAPMWATLRIDSMVSLEKSMQWILELFSSKTSGLVYEIEYYY